MIPRTVCVVTASLLALAGATGIGSAQVTGSAQLDGSPASIPSVTLDQVTRPGDQRPDAADRTAEIEVAQPERPARDAAVLSAGIASRPGDRSIGAAPIGGIDRCDAEGRADRSTLCRQRLETKAGRYARPVPAPVTSEGRLLLLVNPNAPIAPDGRQLGTVSGLDAPNGPAQQLAGALRSQNGQDASPDTTPRGSPDPATPVNGLPPVVLLPTR